jgi:hypothetical protein
MPLILTCQTKEGYMLDVHPPHAPTHTWKDFFLHIATIVIGLLIAVGLEQTVERLHNNHLRTGLQELLRSETTGNTEYIDHDIALAEHYIDWAQHQAAAAQAAGAVRSLSLQRLPPGEWLFPDTGTWLAAKDNGRTALLPQEQQVWYTDLYRMEQAVFASGTGSLERLQASVSSLDRLLSFTDTPSSGDSLDLSALSPENRVAYLQTLAAVQEALRDMERELLIYTNANEFVNRTPPDRWFYSDEMGKYLKGRAALFVAHPRSQRRFSER